MTLSRQSDSGGRETRNLKAILSRLRGVRRKRVSRRATRDTARTADAGRRGVAASLDRRRSRTSSMSTVANALTSTEAPEE